MISHTSFLFLFCFFCIICLSSSSTISYEQAILGPNIDKRPSSDEAIKLFQQWMKDYGRVYKDLEEMANKFGIFISNLNYIINSNAKRSSSNAARSSSSCLFGLNEFADWTHEKFKETYLRELDMPTINRGITLNNTDCVGPSSLDWRTKGVVTPVQNQGECGSCWAFTAVGNIEGVNAIATNKLIGFSEQQLVDCDSTSNGCNGGWPENAYEWVLGNGGIASRSDYPYKGTDGACRGADQVPNSGTIDDYELIHPSEDALLCAILDQPISVALNAVDFKFYKSGIYEGDNCPTDSDEVTHAVLIVGYGQQNGVDYWIVKNSWGPTWGMDGYILIKRNTNLPYGVCSINYYATTATKYKGLTKNKKAFNNLEAPY